MTADITDCSKKWSEMSLKEKLGYLVQNITVEPLMALFIIPCVIVHFTVQNVVLEKACRVNLNYTEEVCNALTERNTTCFKEQETRVQELVAGMTVWKTFLHSAIPAILVMFSGPWSDRKRKRKMCMVVPVVGEALAIVGQILCIYFFYELPMEVSGLVYAILPGITGGWVTLFMGVFSYIAEITTEEDRTKRIGAINIIASATIPLALGVSGILFKNLGFYKVFGFSLVGLILCIIYGYFCIQENKLVDTNEQIQDYDMDTKKTVNRSTLSKIMDFLKDFFTFQNIKETLGIALKKRPNNDHKRIVLIMIVLVLVAGPPHGEMTVIYLSMRYRFNWDEVQFSVFAAYSVTVHIVGVIFSLRVFSHWLKMEDSLLGAISCASRILSVTVYAFAKTDWHLYMGPVADIISGTASITIRSIASKLVSSEELGRLYSLYGACEAFTPLLYGPMYAFLYEKTLDTMPGAFFLLSIVLIIPGIAIFVWMYTHTQVESMPLAATRKTSVPEGVIHGVIRKLSTESVAQTIPFGETPMFDKSRTRGETNAAFQMN